MINASLLWMGMTVRVAGREYKVGQFFPDLAAWDLLDGNERVMTVRQDVLAAMAESIRFPHEVAA